MCRTRFGGSPRARSRSENARRPLSAHLLAAFVSCCVTFWSAAKSPGVRQPAACGPGAQAGSGGCRPSLRPDYLQPIANVVLSLACEPDGVHRSGRTR